MAGRAAFGLTMLALAYSVYEILYAASWAASPLTVVLWSQGLVLTVAMWALLHARCATGSRSAGVAAWTIIGLAVPWSVVAGFSLAAGLFVPALLLLLATGLTPRGGLAS